MSSKKWTNQEKLARYISSRACDCTDVCGPIEAPLEVELLGIAILAFVSVLAFCKRGSLLYYIIFWAIWEAGIYGGTHIKLDGKKGLCSGNKNYKRRFLVIVVSVVAWLVARELFCPRWS